MTHRTKMSEKEKMYFFCLLFPPLWIFIPVMALCDLGDAIRRKFTGR